MHSLALVNPETISPAALPIQEWSLLAGLNWRANCIELGQTSDKFEWKQAAYVEDKSLTNSLENELQRAEPNQLPNQLKASCGKKILIPWLCRPNELLEELQSPLTSSALISKTIKWMQWFRHNEEASCNLQFRSQTYQPSSYWWIHHTLRWLLASDRNPAPCQWLNCTRAPEQPLP